MQRLALLLEQRLKLPLPPALHRHQLVGRQLGGFKVFLLQKGGGDRLHQHRVSLHRTNRWRLSRTNHWKLGSLAELGQALSPEIPLGGATAPQASLHRGAGIHIEQQGLGHLRPALLPQHTADGVKPTGPVEATAKVVGKAAQGRTHRVVHLRPEGDAAANRLPGIALEDGGEAKVGLLPGDHIIGGDTTAIGIHRGAPADRPGLTIRQRIGIGMNPAVTGVEAVTALEFLNQPDRFPGNRIGHRKDRLPLDAQLRNPGAPS